MRRVGLTGGIASGKSAVAARWRELGIPVLDADRLVHALYEPGAPGAAAVVEEFGPEFLDSRGAVDRPRLAALVFADPAAIARLNARVHPLVRAETDRWLAEREADGCPAAAVEATLLVENRGRERFDLLVAVSAPEELRLARALARDPSSNRDAVLARMRAQISDEVRNAACDVVLVSDGSVEELRAKADELAARLRSGVRS
ncbi:MAG TPA: dephospho-CoA kinase [Thermoanaerobaculia bacterium]|nr:dephospho-CoA kinase [Thermoanaerobaculia bacterium]